MTRTFSKIHGLANLRIGWLYGPPAIIDVLNRIRGPFNMNGRPSRRGVAAMEDAAHEDMAVAHNNAWLERMKTALERLDLCVTPSVVISCWCISRWRPARPPRMRMLS